MDADGTVERENVPAHVQPKLIVVEDQTLLLEGKRPLLTAPDYTSMATARLVC